jgi:DNA (cytosine-5)-methyltransferase 1
MKRVAEFFAGIGLMRLGLEKAGWTTVWANDIDEDKQEIYGHNFTDVDAHFILGDVHAIDGATIPDIELATASFPCNDLSLAGSRHGLAGTQSSAFWGFIDAMEAMGARRPSLILLENVPGFLTSHNGDDLRDAIVALNRLGYAADLILIDAARFVPQSRQRLFVVGTKAAATTAKDAPLLASDVRPPAVADFIFMHPELGWNIRALPSLPVRTENLSDIIEELPLNSAVWWSEERSTYLLNQMSPKHRAQADKMIAGSDVTYGTVFRRVRNNTSMAELRTDGIAGCLRTPRGGSGRQILFCAGGGQYRVRLLTPNECARLMGADGFTIKVPLNQALFGFGDAFSGCPLCPWYFRTGR